MNLSFSEEAGVSPQPRSQLPQRRAAVVQRGWRHFAFGGQMKTAENGQLEVSVVGRGKRLQIRVQDCVQLVSNATRGSAPAQVQLLWALNYASASVKSVALNPCLSLDI